MDPKVKSAYLYLLPCSDTRSFRMFFPEDIEFIDQYRVEEILYVDMASEVTIDDNIYSFRGSSDEIIQDG